AGSRSPSAPGNPCPLPRTTSSGCPSVLLSVVRGRCPRVWSWISPRGRCRKPPCVMLPAVTVCVARLLGGKVAVDESHERPVPVRHERHLDGRASGSNAVFLRLPPPGESDAPGTVDRDVLAMRDVAAVGVDPLSASGARVPLG